MIKSPDLNPFQALLLRVGHANKFQYQIYAVFALKWLIAGLFLMSLNFLFLTEEFTCTEEEAPKDFCKEWVCQHREEFWKLHLKNPPRSLAYEFEWYVCGREWVVSLTQSMMYLGSFTGYVTLPFIADNFGRKRSEMISWLIAVFGIVTLSTSMSMAQAGIGLFFCGMGINTAINLHYTFLKEFVIGHTKEIMIITLQIMFSLGVLLTALLAMYVPNWRIACVAFFAIPIVLLLYGYVYIEETPEFSLSKGYNVLLESMNRIATTNERPLLTMEDIEEELKNYTAPEESRLGVWSLFRYKSLRLTTYCCGFVHMAVEFIYDGTLFNLNRVGLSVYTNQMVVAAAEMVASLYCNFVVPRLKRKSYTIICLSLVGVLLLLTAFIGTLKEGNYAIAELGVMIAMRFVLSSLWGFYFVYLTELYPCEITTISIGYMNAVGALAATASPYIKLAAKSWSMVIMAGMSFVAAGHVACLRETKG